MLLQSAGPRRRASDAMDDSMRAASRDSSAKRRRGSRVRRVVPAACVAVVAARSACVAAFGFAPGTTLPDDADATGRARSRRCPRCAARRRRPTRYWREERIAARRHDRQRACPPAVVDDPPRSSSCAPIRRASALSAACPAGRSASRPTTTAGSSRCASSPASGELLADRAQRRRLRRRERAAPVDVRVEAARRRDPLVAVRRRRCRRAARCGDAAARRHLRRRHRLLSRPAARRSLHRRLRNALRRRRAGRRRHASSPPSSSTGHVAIAPSSGAAPTAAKPTTAQDGTAAAQGLPALADRVLAHHVGLLAGALSSDPADLARAQGRRLRRADRHAGARDRRRQGHRSPAGRTATATSSMLQHGGAYSTVYAHLSRFAAGIEARRARRAGRRDRLRRADRLGDRPASALRVPRRQRAAQSADGRAAGCAAAGRRGPGGVCRAHRAARRRARARRRSSPSPPASSRQAAVGQRALHRPDVRHEPRRRRRRAGRFRHRALRDARARRHVAFDPALRAELDALQKSRRRRIAPRGARRQCADGLLRGCRVGRCSPTRGLESADIAAIGVHGQTVRHRPELRLHAPARQSGAARRSLRASPSSPISAAATSPRAGRARRWCPRSTPRCSGDAGAAPRRASISAASPTSPTCRRTGRCAASTPDRATRCSMPGARGIAARRSTATAHGRRPAGRSRHCSRRCSRRSVLRAAAAEEHRARSLQPALAGRAAAIVARTRRRAGDACWR